MVDGSAVALLGNVQQAWVGSSNPDVIFLHFSLKNDSKN
jgi:hypothetical protein